jgi:hypothetical protein
MHNSRFSASSLTASSARESAWLSTRTTAAIAGRSRGSLLQHDFMSANTGSGIDCGSGEGRTLRMHTASGTCAGASSLRGRVPAKSSHRVTPNAKTSIAVVSSPSPVICSGALYWSVPTLAVMCAFICRKRDVPKSPSLTVPRSAESSTLSGLRSRCSTGGTCECRKRRPHATACAMRRRSGTETSIGFLPTSTSPYSACASVSASRSITSSTAESLCTMPNVLTMLAWPATCLAMVSSCSTAVRFAWPGISLTATGSPRNVAAYTRDAAPRPSSVFSAPKSSSAMSISSGTMAAGVVLTPPADSCRSRARTRSFSCASAARDASSSASR